MGLPEKLQSLLDATGKTRVELAAVFGCNRQRIDDLFSGRVGKIKKVEADKAAEQLRISPQWLVNDEGEMFLPQGEHEMLMRLKAIQEGTAFALEMPGLSDVEHQQIQQLFVGLKTKSIDLVRSALGAATDLVMVPRYDIHASAGNGAVIHDETIVDHLAFKRDWIRQSLGLDPSCLALIDVRGDSMSPTIDGGDLLLLDTRPGQTKSEGVYVINLNGSLLVKRLRIRLSGVIEIVSDNPKYGSETISGEELERLVIVGRVVWHGRKF